MEGGHRERDRAGQRRYGHTDRKTMKHGWGKRGSSLAVDVINVKNNNNGYTLP